MLAIYIFTGAAAGFLAAMLTRRRAAPAVAYLAFSIFAGLFVLFILIDTGREHDIPPVRWGTSVFRFEERLKQVEQNLLGYETEVIMGSEAAELRELPEKEGGRALYAVRLQLKHPAVRDSVLLWEGALSKPPNYFTVDGRMVTVKTGVSVKNMEYVVRYFRTPERGVGEGGVGEGGVGGGAE